MPLLEVRAVDKVYTTDGEQTFALRDVSLSVRPGEFVSLVGRSGCGKSTLLHLCGAMDFPTRGEVLLEGTATTSLRDAGLTALRRAQVGFIFQSFQLLPTLSAVENVELPLLLAGVREARARAEELLRWVELGDLGHRLPHQLSGGQQQRVAVARSLVHQPKLLLADEPIGNLDTTTGELVLDLLRRAAVERGTAILMATHSRESTAKTDTVVMMRDGCIEEIRRFSPVP